MIISDSITKDLEETIALLQEMQGISAQQVQLLTDCGLEVDMDALEGLMEQRQNIMDVIDGIDEKLQKQIGTNSDSGNQVLLNLEKSTAYPKYLNIIKAIILAIKDNDLIYQSLLEKVLQETKSKLASLRNNQKAHKAYLQEDIYTEGCFIDKKK
jgi:hypothetical protein